jgi:predicted ATP-grasp superfamily ATP-dependent carboligase
LPPCLLLGGEANALSVARSLGRQGVTVYALADDPRCVLFSRYCHWLPVPWAGDDETSWTPYLLGPDSDWLRGAVLLACRDSGILTIAHNREALAQKFLLDDSNVPAQLCLLNKLSTYRAGVAAGVPTPRFWVVHGRDDVERLRASLVFPLLVKPLFSHRFGPVGHKFLVADNFPQLAGAYDRVRAAGIEVLLMEMIPGPDSSLCSYYTYLDAHGEPLFHFTKRVIRRFPVGEGNGCYHITDWNPEVRDLGLRLFRHVGLRGLANVEFKHDPRDGRLKLIECNARFTAANCLVAASGLDLARLVYNRLVGLPLPPLEPYVREKRLWYPVGDTRAYLVLRRRKELTFWGWLRSLAHPQIFVYFQWSDPGPALGAAVLRGRTLPWLARRIRDLVRPLAASWRRRRGSGLGRQP